MSEEWRFYGRRIGRKLNQSRQDLLDTLLPALSVPEDQITSNGDLNPFSFFKTKPQKIILEIGFGNGERLAQHISREPDTGFIGAEAFINGVTAFLRDIDEQQTINNIRLHADDALPLVKSFTPHSIDALYILNPDPWHKTRHHKRRIVNSENLTEFSRILKPGGTLVMSTDVPDLIDWMVTHAINHPDFTWDAKSADDWRAPPPNWIPTRYETKGAKGADHMNYLFFSKET